ncbi:MAG: MFS transporter, partial [Chloroflexi bacterium]|nr:MFS transporter [Chloroflexota bacterium]
MMIGQALMPVGFLAAGPLADLLFEPAMAEGGALAGLLGGMLGTGPGRGMGVMFIIGGVLILLATVGAMAAPALRNVEDDLPDYVPATDIQPELEPEPVPAR